MRKQMAILSCFIFTYLMFAFGAWDFNAGNWSMDARAIAIIIAFGWSVLTFSYLKSEE